jgi:hypothetical protein
MVIHELFVIFTVSSKSGNRAEFAMSCARIGAASALLQGV